MVVFAGRTETDSAAPTERFERLVDLPPSAKFVFHVLEREAPATQTTLADETLLSRRTIRAALTSLVDADVVEERRLPRDARKKVYRPRPVERERATEER